jgi:ribosomal protein L37E
MAETGQPTHGSYVPPVITVCVECGESYPYERRTKGCDACGLDDTTRLYRVVG